MGFIKEIYSDNRAGLVVVFGRGKTSENYFDGDSVEAAMAHFNIYLKNNEMFIKTEDEKAIEDLGIKTEDASELRSTIDTIITTLDDEQAVAAPILFPIWQAGVEYKIGDRIRYQGKLYKVIQDHTGQIGWEPIIVPSLFAAMLIDEQNNNILNWMQPNSTNGYSIGDKVIYNEKFWISTANDNIWSPDTLNAPWQEYITNWENGTSYALSQKVIFNNETYISLIEQNTSIPTNENYWTKYNEEIKTETETETEEKIESDIAEWIQPDSSSAYFIGDKVLFNGIVYESLIDNNVWSPADYAAGWNQVSE